MLRLRRKVLILWIFLLLTCPVTRTQAENGLAGRIEEVIKDPKYRQARWGILLVNAENGKTIYEHNADQLFLPASTTKLFSCAAALSALGADYRFETPVYQRGTVTDGRLQGDLILVARGDLTMGGRTNARGKMAFKDHDHIYANFLPGAELTDTDPLTGLNTLAKQVADSGIRHISGEVLIDDRYFAKNRGSGSGPDLLTPIVINDNVVDIVAAPASEVGKPAKLQIRPESRFVQIDAQIETVAEGQSPNLAIQSGGPQRYIMRGRIPVKSKPLVLIYPVDDPTAFARALFIEALHRAGVTVTASPLQTTHAVLPDKNGYGKLTRVAMFSSPPFSELIKVTLKVSHNLYASTLPILVSAQNGQGSLIEGLKLQRQFLADLGVAVETISFGGAAGGAPADAVTPRATVQLLQGLAKRPDYPVFAAGLPVLGIDGTLADVVKPDSPARGKVHAKTGTLVWHDVMNNRTLLTSKALAGTLTTASDRQLIVAMFVNGVPLPNGVTATREGKVLGRLCEIIVQNAP
jgi:D-alanyl-D-alanine carboxypeptidase/D-alanyl-D-alanine-endopeptidase (penicillin-binding protein 4)